MRSGEGSEISKDATVWHFPVMSTLTAPLPEEDLAFLRAYSEAHGTSAEAFLARQARNLREHLQTPVLPEVTRVNRRTQPGGDAAGK